MNNRMNESMNVSEQIDGWVDEQLGRQTHVFVGKQKNDIHFDLL